MPLPKFVSYSEARSGTTWVDSTVGSIEPAAIGGCAKSLLAAVPLCGGFVINEIVRRSSGLDSTSPFNDSSLDKIVNSLAGPCIGALTGVAINCAIDPLYNAIQRCRNRNGDGDGDGGGGDDV